MKNEKPITKEMTIAEVISKYPSAAMVLLEHGFHCVGCHIAAAENLEQGAYAHGMDKEQLDKMIKKMNNLVEESNNGKT